MSDIDIRHKHSLPLPKARKAVEEIAKKLAAKFDMDYGWEGDNLYFNRSGVEGHIHLTDTQVRVTARLGFLLSALKGTVEQEIRRVLAERFG
ncbi:MAG TPA: polyhydroxyalkanoic acid system family protein [Lysobacter sp.]|nr:polyhydroxyalkanoic acid system family protein [Lysobacter sp.]